MSNHAAISQIGFQDPLHTDREILIKVIFDKYFKSRLQRYNTVSTQRQKNTPTPENIISVLFDTWWP